MRFLTRKGFLIEKQGVSYLADTDLDLTLGPLRAAACTYRIAFGPQARQKVLSLQTVPTREPSLTPGCCVGEHGFSLHAEVSVRRPSEEETRTPLPLHHPPRHCQRKTCTQPGRAGGAHPETHYRDGTTHIVMSPLEFMQRLAALVPRPRLHLIRFHSVLAPNAKLRPEIIPNVPVHANTPSADHREVPLLRRLPP